MLRYIPLVIIEGYLALTVLLFLSGPFEWPRVDFFLLSAFLLIYQIALAVGYHMGAYKSRGVRKSLDANRWFKISLVVSIVLIVPYTYIYTGKYPWDVLLGVPDQAQAFAEYYQRLSMERTPERILIMVARTFFSPVTVALIPLIFWTKRLTAGWKLLFVVYVLLYFSFSLLRGTDKESADFLVFFFVGLCSWIAVKKIAKENKTSRATIWLVPILLACTLWASYATFMERKMARLGGDGQVCIQQVDVCADMNRGVMPYLDDRDKFGFSMATLYLSIGYYGMGMALEEEFESALGFGHSLFVANGVSQLDGLGSFFDRTYTKKISEKGWDVQAYWATTYTWLANDVGFFGVALLMVLIGFVFSRTWHDVIFRKDPVAIVLFSQIVLMLFYLPAFNVTMQNMDSYYAFVFWLALWVVNVSCVSRSIIKNNARQGVVQ